MDDYLSAAEAASMLGIAGRQFATLKIHACPEGYAPGRIEAFARRHELPVLSRDDVALGDAPAHGRWQRADTLEQALFWRPKTLFMASSPAPSSLRRMQPLPIHLVGVGWEHRLLHDTVSNWKEATHYP